ncbi:MAG: preprotein translocase subunit SecE [Clostridia bacterium]|nr:preprotein translocase subunit SecE [Clostridia bacterium]
MAENEKKVPVSEDAETKEVAKAGAKTAKAKEKKPSLFSRIGSWFRTTKAELKKIAWTPRKTLWKNTALVLVAMVVLAVVIGLLDVVFLAAIDGLSAIF